MMAASSHISPMPQDAPGRKHVFISYSRRNRAVVEQIATDLENAGIHVWIDKSGLKPGTRNWEQALRDAIRDAFAIVFIASPDARQSNYVQAELAIGEMYNRKVYPVWVEGEHWVDSAPMELVKTQFVDLREASYTAALPDLIRALRGENTTPIPKQVAPPPANFSPRNPFKGLRSFTQTDVGDFFGREKLVQQLIGNLQESAFLAVVGPSGSGKSSVVMAGILPQLQQNALPNSSQWLYLPPVVPGTHPLESLAIPFANALKLSTSAVRQDLEDPSGRGLSVLAQRLISDQHARVVLYIDQFEELFTQVVSEDEQRQFIDLIVNALSTGKNILTVIISLRADFYDRPMKYPTFVSMLEAHTRLISPMSVEELRAAIEGPAQLADVRLTFEDGLVGDLLFEVRDQSGALPLLQFTLTQLFEKRVGQKLTWAAYHELGGIRGALAKHAEATYQTLPSEEHKRLAKALFLRLIEPGVTEIEATRRRAPLQELILTDQQRTQIYQTVADTFINARLLVTNRIAETETIEVSHEALIREWKQLAHWLLSARTDIEQQQAISDTALEWARRGRKPDDDILYRGSILREAEAWAERNVPTQLEDDFLRASLQAEALQLRREQRQRRLIQASALFVVVVIVFASALIAVLQSDSAARLAEQAQLANNNAATSDANADALATARQDAQIEAERAIQAENTAVAAANGIGTEAARAENNAATAMFQSGVSRSLALASQAQLELRGPSPERAVPLAIEALEQYPYTLQAERVLAESIRDSRLRMEINAHENIVNAVIWSPDGRRIISGSRDGTARIWDAQTGQLLLTLDARDSGGINDIALSMDARWLASAHSDGTVHLWDTTTGTEAQVFRHTSYSLSSLDWSPDGTKIVSASYDGTVIVWDVAERQLLFTLDYGNEIYDVSWSPQRPPFETYVDMTGNYAQIEEPEYQRPMIAIVGEDNGILLLDAETGKLIRTIEQADEIYDALWFNDGLFLFTCSRDQECTQWDVFTGEEFNRIYSNNRYRQMVVAPEGLPFAALIDSMGQLSIWRSGAEYSWREETVISSTNGQFTALAWSPETTRIVTANENGLLQLWRAGGQEIYRGSERTNELAFSPGNDYLLVGNSDFNAHVIDPVNNRILFTLPTTLREREIGKIIPAFARRMPDAYGGGGFIGVAQVLWSPANGRIITLNTDSMIDLWSSEDGTHLSTLEYEEEEYPNYIAVSPTNGQLAILRPYGVIQILHPDTYEIVRERGNFSESAILKLQWSPDGQYLAILHENNIVRIWHVESDHQQSILSGHSDYVYTLSWSADSTHLLTASADSTARQWDIATGEELQRYTGHTDGVLSAIWLANDQRILTTGEDGTIRVWNALDGSELFVFENDTYLTGAFAASGGTFFAGIDGYQSPVVWHMWADMPGLIAYARHCCLLRPLNNEERDGFALPTLSASPTPTATLSPTPALSPSATVIISSLITPSATPDMQQDIRIVEPGEYRGNLILGETDLWGYQGEAGEIITIRVNADYPANEITDTDRRLEMGLLDPLFIVRAPNNTVLVTGAMSDDIVDRQQTDAIYENLRLPTDGLYRIEVQAFQNRSEGDYTLIIERISAGE